MAFIKDIEYFLPHQIVTNEDLNKEKPEWNLGELVKHTGVHQRHVAQKEESSLDLGFKAVKKLLESHSQLSHQIDTLIFCTQTPLQPMPSNSCLLHEKLNLSQKVACFDINHACSGFIYSLWLAKALIASGQCQEILIVTADTYSKIINPNDRATRSLFGDGAAVTWVSSKEGFLKIENIAVKTSGKDHRSFILPEPTSYIQMDGVGVLSFVNHVVAPDLIQFLSHLKIKKNEVNFYLFHQASLLALNTLVARLELDPQLVPSNLENKGNLVSASIPILLKDVSSQIKPGYKVVMSGFGVGMSWGHAFLIGT